MGAMARLKTGISSVKSCWLLAPFILFFLLFWVAPLIGGVRLSVYSDDLVGPGSFVGLQHYRQLLDDDRYFKAVRNTIVYTVSVVVVLLPLSLLTAHLLRSAFVRLRTFLTFLFLLPGLTPPSVLALLFLLNQVFVVPFGGVPIQWLKDPDFIMPALVLQAVWRWNGFITLFLLSGMDSIPKAHYETVSLETDNPWKVFRLVTLPGISHVLIFCAVYLTIDAFSLFSGAYILLGGSGGTSDSGLLLLSYAYPNAFSFGRFGTAASISLSVVPFLAALLGICFLGLSRRRSS